MQDITHDTALIEQLRKMPLVDIQLASIKVEEFNAKLQLQLKWVDEDIEGLGLAKTALVEHENRYYAIQIFELGKDRVEVTLFVERIADNFHFPRSDDVPPKAKVLRFLKELGATELLWFNEYEFLMPEEKIKADIEYYSRHIHDEDMIRFVARKHQVSEEVILKKLAYNNHHK